MVSQRKGLAEWLLHNARIALEDGTFFRVVDVRLEGDNAVLAGDLKQVVEKLQHVDVDRLVGAAALHDPGDVGQTVFSVLIGTEISNPPMAAAPMVTNSAGLKQNEEFAAGHGKAADDAQNDHDNADDR